MLADHEDLVEADLRRFCAIRYTDRWRFDEHGQRRLTLREISVQIRNLPGDSSIVRHFNDGKRRWDEETFLLADLIHVMSGKPHPARPTPPKGVDLRETAKRSRIRAERVAAKRRREIAAARKQPT